LKNGKAILVRITFWK